MRNETQFSFCIRRLFAAPRPQRALILKQQNWRRTRQKRPPCDSPVMRKYPIATITVGTKQPEQCILPPVFGCLDNRCWSAKVLRAAAMSASRDRLSRGPSRSSSSGNVARCPPPPAVLSTFVAEEAEGPSAELVFEDGFFLCWEIEMSHRRAIGRVEVG